jgi:hypothetical protein
MRTRHAGRIALAVIAPVLIAAAYWYLGTHHVPDGQPALSTLDAASIESLRNDFNRAAGETRIIVLLAPT